MQTKTADTQNADGRRELLNELCLTESDLDYMGRDQRVLVEDIIDKVLKIRAAA